MIDTENKLLASYDSNDDDYSYYNFVDDIEEIMRKMQTKKFFCYGEALTWRNVFGYTQFETSNPNELIRKITPNSDFSIEIFETDVDRVFDIVTYHHDKPMGETLHLMSQHKASKLDILNEKGYERNI